MAKVVTVQKSRFPNKCGKCGDTIPKGASYKHAQQRGSPLMVRCLKNACRFRNADLSSAKTAPLLDAIEDAESAIGDADSLDGIKSALESVAQVAQEAASEYRDASSNWAGGSRQEWDDKADALDDYASTLEDWQPSEDEPAEGTSTEANAATSDEWQGWFETIQDEALSALDDRGWE